mmetsp:Transcript_23382/g.34206  ORF Transcript_23382/g.34206 Transcript_23382/m.34206 type:complete len:114 (+) Transcript_23382:113-454(+)
MVLPFESVQHWQPPPVSLFSSLSCGQLAHTIWHSTFKSIFSQSLCLLPHLETFGGFTQTNGFPSVISFNVSHCSLKYLQQPPTQTSSREDLEYAQDVELCVLHILSTKVLIKS